MEATVGDVSGNVAQAFELVERAARAGAKYIALPEFFTTQIIVDDRVHRCALPTDNAVVKTLAELARRHDAVIGGSFLEFDNGDVFNTYTLVMPNGTIHRHRKDLPTMAECAYYVGGNDRGLVDAGDLAFGIAVCWETVRAGTVRRLAGACDLIMSGSHWWSAPEWRLLRPYWRHHARLNASFMHRTPGRFARLVGAPMLHGSHCGVLKGRFAVTSRLSLPVQTHLVGEAQIVDASGAILARRTKEEGAGHILAEIEIGRVPVTSHPPRGFWLERLPPLVRAMWTIQNSVGRQIYKRARKNGRIVPLTNLRIEVPHRSLRERNTLREGSTVS